MRTGLFLLAGVLLLAVFFILARLFTTQYPAASVIALTAFAVAWLAVAGFNLWVGVSHAGYSVSEELPIFLLIYALPVAVAALVKWRLA